MGMQLESVSPKMINVSICRARVKHSANCDAFSFTKTVQMRALQYSISHFLQLHFETIETLTSDLREGIVHYIPASHNSYL